MRITVDPALASIVTLGVLSIDRARVHEHDARLDAPLAEAARAMSAMAGLDERVQEVRAMYRRVGIDPTKTRPSSEALLRRVRKGEPLPRINSLVDICNWCSLEFQLPYGLYDRDKIEGQVALRLGRPGEMFPGIRKETVHVAGRLALADEHGAFGNPTSDSARTMITLEASRALVVIYAPKRVAEARLRSCLDITSSRMSAYTGAVEVAREIL